MGKGAGRRLSAGNHHGRNGGEQRADGRYEDNTGDKGGNAVTSQSVPISSRKTPSSLVSVAVTRREPLGRRTLAARDIHAIDAKYRRLVASHGAHTSLSLRDRCQIRAPELQLKSARFRALPLPFHHL